MKTLAIILIVGGVLALVYQGFTYTKTSEIAKIGTLEIKANTQKTVPIPPILGAVAIVAGASMLLVGRRQTI